MPASTDRPTDLHTTLVPKDLPEAIRTVSLGRHVILGKEREIDLHGRAVNRNNNPYRTVQFTVTQIRIYDRDMDSCIVGSSPFRVIGSRVRKICYGMERTCISAAATTRPLFCWPAGSTPRPLSNEQDQDWLPSLWALLLLLLLLQQIIRSRGHCIFECRHQSTAPE